MSGLSPAGPAVLLVEDEPLNRALVRAILERTDDPRLAGLDLVEAPTLAAARAWLAAHEPAVILLDVRLPDGDGLVLARELAAGPAPRPRLAVMSASVLPADHAAALAAGCDTFIGKPVRLADFVAALAQLLEG